MRKKCLILCVLFVLFCAVSLPAQARNGGFRTDTGTYVGDFDELLKRGIIRVAVPFSRTLFFYDKGHQLGLAADAIRDLERHLKARYRGKQSLRIIVMPMTFDRLLPSLVEGKVDVAAGNIAVTEDRLQLVDFTVPTTDPMNEIVVTGPSAPQLKSLDDLSDREVHVRGATSYRQSLDDLNERFAREGKAPIRIVFLPNELQDEDVLDMLNAGLIQIAVKDDRLVKLWTDSLPNISLHEDLVLRANGTIAWAVRKNSPQLLAVLNSIIPKATRKGLQAALYEQFARDAKKMRNARGDKDMQRFDSLVGLFKKYGDKYGFDSLLLMAQGYQESGLDQTARSPMGAIGVMQIMPGTGKTLGVGDIRQVEPNIHGGAKYLASLMEGHFKGSTLDETNRTLFAFAGYNCGEARVARSRIKAQKQGYDPNVWFNNVEVLVAKDVGQEPVRYVRNIFKYYVAYKLEQQSRTQRDKALNIQTARELKPRIPCGG